MALVIRVRALACICVLLFAILPGSARADEDRYVPASRGPRATYGTPQVEQWREVIAEYDWPVEQALLVVSCESEGDPDAVNPSSGATGLFQLYGWRSLAERLTGSPNLRNGWVNVRTAYELWRDSGRRFGWHWYASMPCWAW